MEAIMWNAGGGHQEWSVTIEHWNHYWPPPPIVLHILHCMAVYDYKIYDSILLDKDCSKIYIIFTATAVVP